MRITIEPTEESKNNGDGGDYYSVVVESPRDDLNIAEVACLIRAALLGWGYPIETIDGVFDVEQ